MRFRIPLYDPSFPYIILWSQKSGCTTVVKWFFAQLGILDEAFAHSPWIHDYESRVFKRREGYQRELLAALKSGSHKVVKVVRDPMVRAPSAFLVLAEKGAIIKHRRHWVQDHWALVDEWLASRGLDPAEGINFLEHLDMVNEFETRLPQSINQHLSPQYINGEEAFVQRHIPIESFTDWVKEVSGEPGVKPIDLEAIEGSSHHHGSDPARTAALGETPETARITRGVYADWLFPSSRAFINERSIAKIRETYRLDFKAYGDQYQR
ncbi:sulfotransferase family 2 domain-containing protein [Acuticoccus kandeliae]|uniref:sulfotransferase family 2 domain-containing protein n=1 Tax=Acuticoccus kandeliae TaxID=2073160 RepID=UPI0013001A9E|nr:sulfotransferase family 2 domain-containing protein [Acuticoccus kandeliae]